MSKYSILFAFILLPFFTIAQKRHYVKANAQGANDGSSWENAYNTLNPALAKAKAGDSIWVAAGTYRPTTDAVRDSSFEVKSGVVLLGGFEGNEQQAVQRKWQKNETILSGDIGKASDSTDNAYNVVFMESVDSSTVLDGFTVRDGNANIANAISNLSRGRSGGGLYINGTKWEAYPFIANCRFVHNTAQFFGGGVLVYADLLGFAAPLFRNCIFEDNRCSDSGGGLCMVAGDAQDRGIDFKGCRFVRNYAGKNGGGAFCNMLPGVNSPQFVECLFEQNASVRGGGGVYIFNNGVLMDIYFDDCDFVKNSSEEGAAISYFSNFHENRDMTIINGNFIENKTIDYPGLSIPNGIVYVDQICTPTSINVIQSLKLSGNTSLENSCLSLGDSDPSFTLVKNIEIEGGSANFIKASGKKIYLSNIVARRLDALEYNILFNFNNTDSLYLYNCFIDANPIRYGACFLNGVKNAFLSNNIFLNTSKSQMLSKSQLEDKIKILTSNCYFEDVKNIPKPEIVFNNNAISNIQHSYIKNIDCANMPKGMTCGPGILTGIDPLFVSPDSGDYRLQPCSPLVNAGTNAVVIYPTDLAGQPRIQGGIVDIGAYETTPYKISDASITKTSSATATDGKIALSIQGGTPPHTASWQHGATGLTIENLKAGEYTVTVTDKNGCTFSMTYMVGVTSSAGEPSVPAFSVAPNPTNGLLQLILQEPAPVAAPLRLFDAQGRLVRQWTLPQDAQRLGLQVGELPSGVYQLVWLGRGVKVVVVGLR